ncbi:MAG: hypothetical protein U0228_27935 [Myxococcaceae bacterium]
MSTAQTLTEKDRADLTHALTWDAKRFGQELADTAYARGLAVTNKDDGTTKPIPITATPVIIDGAELKRRQDLAAKISSATMKMSNLVLRDAGRRDLVLDGLSPLEKELAQKTFEHLSTLVTTRVDFFVKGTGAAAVKALEVNATIPAMQGYSDIAANTLLEVVGRTWGAPDHVIAGWMSRNGNNSMALYRALLQGYAQVRPGKSPNTIALLSRRNDAQLTEQKYLCEKFREWGADADVVHPDQLSGTDAVMANGKKYDLVYRHLFVRRLEEAGMQGADYVKALLAEENGTRAVVLNPPASQVEVKAVFALLSQALVDSRLVREARLTEAEVEAIKACVPWTRHFSGDELLAKVTAEPDKYVLKRSWDYGGRAVFVGRTRGEPGFAERVKTAYGEVLEWEALCARAAKDTVGGGFVVQEIVEIEPEDHLLCSGPAQIPTRLFVDFSAYASVGLPEQPKWGGVCRGSISHIVNIVGGGGVIPLITEDVAKSLLSAYRAWGK